MDAQKLAAECAVRLSEVIFELGDGPPLIMINTDRAHYMEVNGYITSDAQSTKARAAGH